MNEILRTGGPITVEFIGGPADGEVRAMEQPLDHSVRLLGPPPPWRLLGPRKPYELVEVDIVEHHYALEIDAFADVPHRYVFLRSSTPADPREGA